QPQRFRREFETQYPRFRQRVVPMLRLIIPIFLVSYPLALASQAALIPLHLEPSDAFLLLLNTALGVAGGIAFGVAVGIAFGVAVGIAGGIAVGIAGGIVGGIAGANAFGIAGGIAGGIVV